MCSLPYANCGVFFGCFHCSSLFLPSSLDLFPFDILDFFTGLIGLFSLFCVYIFVCFHVYDYYEFYICILIYIYSSLF